MKTIPLAAVFDRLLENEPGSHRQPLQGAVYDRRMENEPDALVAQLEV